MSYEISDAVIDAAVDKASEYDDDTAVHDWPQSGREDRSHYHQ